jgi:hypothetical protein
MRSTFRRTRSAASSGRRSRFCSANRYSMPMFFPSIQPSLAISCQNAANRPVIPEALLASRKPMRKTFPVCCAWTEQQKESIEKKIVATLFNVLLTLTPLAYLMTRSALARILGGTTTPICLAVFRFITSSNFDGCSTGKSAGLAPLRILSTYVATRRWMSATSAP